VAVDDGSACSLAAYAVVETLHLQGAEVVIYAAPLCPPGVSGRIEYDARVITLCPPSEFRSLKLVDSCLEGTSLEEAGCLIAESRQYAKVEKIGSHGEGEPEPWRSGPGERPFGGTARAAQHSSLS
jgi:predicted phosphoribosyltransferase